MKDDARWSRGDKMQHDNQPANKRQPGGKVDNLATACRKAELAC
jgi:hypothetical protein